MINQEKQPNSQPAEIAVLGTLLWNHQAIKRIDNIITVNDFFNNKHKIIYDCLLKLHSENQPFDLTIIQNELEDRKQLSEVGGVNYIVTLQEQFPDPILIEKYAQIIREKALLRELIQTSLNNITYAQNIGSKSPDSLFDEVEKSISELSKKRQKTSGQQIRDVMKKTAEYIAMVSTGENGLTGIPSGFPRLDKITGGFQKSDLIILAARPGIGKTSLAINWGLNAAEMGYSLGIISIEMANLQLGLRMVSSMGDINQTNLRMRKLSDNEGVNLNDTLKKLGNLKIVMEDNGSLTLRGIKSIARTFKFEYKIDLLIVDYLQLINNKRSDGRVNEITEISRSLKALAKELDIPIICLSQLSRDCVKNKRRPDLSDLRDSGAIEQDADIVIFIHREIINDENADPTEAELIIAKHRNGETGLLKVNFEPTTTKFTE